MPDLVEGERVEVSCTEYYGGPRVDETHPQHMPEIGMNVDGQSFEGTVDRIEGIPGPEYKRHRLRMVGDLYMYNHMLLCYCCCCC